MSTLLVGSTVFSLFLAAIMTAIASKVLHENRARSAARVAALQALADETPSPAAPAVLSVPARIDDAFDLALRETVDSGQADHRAWTRPERVEPVPASVHALFEEPALRTPGFRWTWIAAVGLVMAAGAGVFYAISSGRIGPVFAASAPKPVATPAAPIELLSLRHSIDASGSFTVTGLVQNPAASASLHGVYAVVYLFDAEGRYFANSRAALESAVLSPGGEAAFTVRVPASSLPSPTSLPSPIAVSRYRVSFQQENGAAVNHVDRRGALPENTTGDAVQTPAATPLVTARKN